MIEELRIMRGPNIWSRENRKLIVLKLDPVIISNQTLETIAQELEILFPSLHKSLKNILSTLRNNNSVVIAEIVALIGRELQARAVVDPKFSKAFMKGKSSVYSVFAYEEEEVGKEAAYIADKMMQQFFAGEKYLNLEEDIAFLRNTFNDAYMGPSTNAIVQAALKRDIPYRKILDGRYVMLGQGKHLHRIEGSVCETTSTIAVEIASDKEITKQLLADAFIPVPPGVIVKQESDLNDALRILGYPLVTKPLDGNQGKGISTAIKNKKQLQEGFKKAKEFASSVIVEKQVYGNDYRFLVIDFKFVAAAKRDPASVIGDGYSSIKELIERVNANPKRGDGHENILTKITVNESTLGILEENGLTLDSVLKKGKKCILKDTANLSTGGTARDVTDSVHPDNILLAERVAKIIGLNICGIDIIAPDVETPFVVSGGAVIEVNASPGLRMHIAPSSGTARDVGRAIIDMVFEPGSQARIPIVAVTGTNGKTTTCRLIAHLAQTRKFNVGLTTTDGVYLNGKLVEKGDCSGPKSTALVLQEPSIDFAVLECARGGILRSGLAFDKCDIGIVTNVAGDHLGLKDIDTIEDMAKVKAVIPQSVKENGYAILNASDDLVYQMSEGLYCHIALFSIDAENERIIEHCNKGGLAAVQKENGDIVVRNGNREVEVENVKNIPITIGGKATFMTENVLPAVLSAYILNFSIEDIREALHTFIPDEEHAPGRLNVFTIADVNVMVDYVHNAHGFRALSGLMNNIKEHKTGIITGVGDRREEDIIEIGTLTAGMFDDIIIRIDHDTRGRSEDEIVSLLKKGIEKVNSAVSVDVIPDTRKALLSALKKANPGDYIVISADDSLETIGIVKELHTLIS
jgi:cyanophycin synthetase